jgi:DNA-binding Lrp family transcriptional regulator
LSDDDEDIADSDYAEGLRDKYPGMFDPPYSRRSYKLLRGAMRFEQASPKEKRMMTKNFHRREKVYFAIRQALLGGPKSFSALWGVVGGSRSTVSNCLKALCEDEIIKRNNLRRDYELRTYAWINLAKIRSPSAAYCKRQIRKDRTTVTENCSAVFYPRTGLIRIDESKPNLIAAVSALLDPVYFALRKSGIIRFEIDINLRARGTIEIVPTQREREIAEWRQKSASWVAEDNYGRTMSFINRKRRAVGSG